MLLNEGIDLPLLDDGVGVVHVAMMCLISTNATNNVHPLGILREFPVP